MKAYKKVANILITGLVILAVALVIYFLIPKYQIINDSGTIYKLNKITGQVTRDNKPYKPSVLKKPEGYGD
jgi:hypothetical protein